MTWTPKQTLSNSIGGARSPMGTTNQPAVELPPVGETMQILVHSYGGFSVIFEASQIPNGAAIIEVEVKAIKKAKVTLE